MTSSTHRLNQIAADSLVPQQLQNGLECYTRVGFGVHFAVQWMWPLQRLLQGQRLSRDLAFGPRVERSTASTSLIRGLFTLIFKSITKFGAPKKGEVHWKPKPTPMSHLKMTNTSTSLHTPVAAT